MMLEPKMSDLLKKIDNRYLLVNITAKRAREISEEMENGELESTEKPVTIALEEINSGEILPVEASEADDKAVTEEFSDDNIPQEENE